MDSGLPVVEVAVDVTADPEVAFDRFMRDINRWWRHDSRYWNAPERARGLRFEPFVGGRFIEVYDTATGEGFEIGRVTAWEPGRRLAFTWREAGWGTEEVTEVQVTFTPTGNGTRVSLRHGGWGRVRNGLRQAGSYGAGWKELLGWYGGL